MIGFIGRPLVQQWPVPNPVDTLAVGAPLMGSTFCCGVGHAFNEVLVKHAGIRRTARCLEWDAVEERRH